MQLPYPTSLEKSGKKYLLALEVEFCLQCSKLYNSHWCKLLLNLSQNTENMLLPVRQLNAQWDNANKLWKKKKKSKTNQTKNPTEPPKNKGEDKWGYDKNPSIYLKIRILQEKED